MIDAAPGIYSPLEMLDFGILRTLDEPSTLRVSLINSGSKAIQIAVSLRHFSHVCIVHCWSLALQCIFVIAHLSPQGIFLRRPRECSVCWFRLGHQRRTSAAGVNYCSVALFSFSDDLIFESNSSNPATATYDCFHLSFFAYTNGRLNWRLAWFSDLSVQNILVGNQLLMFCGSALSVVTGFGCVWFLLC